MHNPLFLFTTAVLNELLRLGHSHFVRQTYRRGLDPFATALKGAYLVSHYLEASYACIHYDALEHDGGRFLYDASNPEHLEKLRAASTQPPGYAIYTLHLAKEKWKVPADMQEKLKRYISGRLHWKPGKDSGVHATLFSQFGELSIALQWRNQELKIPLSEIEKA